MRSFSEIRESPNYQRLKNSVEFKTELRNTVVVSCTFGALWILLLLTQEITIIEILFILISSGLIMNQLYRVFHIFSHIDSYTYMEALLDRPHLCSRGTRYFTVRIRDRSGREFDADTHSIFSRSAPCFEDYVNQKVLIGYNNVTGLVVVIQKLP